MCGASFGAGNYGMCGRGYNPRDTRNVLGFALSICKDSDARAVRPVQFGVARP